MSLRTLLITLSRSHSLQELITTQPPTRRVANRFVAGETLDEAIAAVKHLNTLGLMATLNCLGENAGIEAGSLSSSDACLAALDAVATVRLDSNLSIKLTGLGLDLGDEVCYANVERIVTRAAVLGNFVRIDIEGSQYTQRTLDLYRRLRRSHDNVGLAIQTYLYRSRADVECLIEQRVANLRLCKGAYDEPLSVAYPQKRDVDESFIRLAHRMLQATARAAGAYSAFATHDERIIKWVCAYVYHQGIPATAYEFQMLYGVREDLQQRLVDEGHRVRVYVPYGTHWYPYVMRRLAERPTNLFSFLRS
jgi:proline dehydrogenase